MDTNSNKVDVVLYLDYGWRVDLLDVEEPEAERIVSQLMDPERVAAFRAGDHIIYPKKVTCAEIIRHVAEPFKCLS